MLLGRKGLWPFIFAWAGIVVVLAMILYVVFGLWGSIEPA